MHSAVFFVTCEQSDRHGESNRHMFATSLANGPKNHELLVSIVDIWYFFHEPSQT
jgi:hypothetical protein